jgi:hypothetical protein
MRVTYIIRVIKFFFVCILIIHADNLFPEEINGMGFGVFGGYSRSTGYYSSEFKSTGMYGVEFIPVIRNWFTFDVIASYRKYTLANSNESSMTDISAGLGGRLFCKIGFIAPYAGFIGGGDYLRLDAKITEKKSESYKPMVSGKTGLLIFFPRGITGDIRGEYSYREMSGRPFKTISFTGGLVFRFGGTTGSGDDAPRVPPSGARDFSAGIKSYNNKHIADAERYFRKVPAGDVLFSESNRYLREIAELQNIYSQAQMLIKQDKLIESIPFLEQVSPKMIEAEDDLAKVRKRLLEKVDNLEKIGIAAYEKKNYKQCISVMKVISAIDPDNKIVRVYLPRALKREQAISLENE